VIAAILLCVSTVVFCQLGLYYWRTNIADIASGQVSDRMNIAAGIPASVTASDFRAILAVHDLTPDLEGSGHEYRAVRAYYSLIEKIANVIPPLRPWADVEMAVCSRYAAVLVDQHLEGNMNYAAHLPGV
jgi:hypothetical protein